MYMCMYVYIYIYTYPSQHLYSEQMRYISLFGYVGQSLNPIQPANLEQQWHSFAARATVASVASTIVGIADAISSEGTGRAWSFIES